MNMGHRQIFSRQEWTIFAFLAILVLFVANSFESWDRIVPAILLAILVVAIQIIRIYNGPTAVANPQSIGSDKNSQPQKNSRVLYWGVGVLISIGFAATRIPEYIARASINPLELITDVLAHFGVGALLYLWGTNKGRGHGLMLALGLICVMMSVLGGSISNRVDTQLLIAFCVCTGYLLMSQAILSQPTVNATPVRRSGDFWNKSGRDRIRLLFSVLTISAILIATGMFGRFTGIWIDEIQAAVHSTLKDTLDDAISQVSFSGTRYVRGATIGSIRNDISSNPDEIALYLFSSETPGYLRGNAFDYYRHGRWRSAVPHESPVSWSPSEMDDANLTAAAPALTPLKTGNSRPMERFEFVSNPGPASTTIEIRNIPIKGHTVFLPLNTRWIESSSNRITYTPNGIIRHGVDITNPYVAGVYRDSVTENLEGDRRDLLLWIPEEVRQVATPIADGLCQGANNAREKAARISQYFSISGQYSLERTARPRDTDPIAYFLSQQHAAHCEYFASATVLMLRSQGIPCRYVTGYVADEMSEDSDYWIARNRDAHAWVEAFDDDSGHWFPVESTPGRTYHSLASIENTEESEMLDFGLEENLLSEDQSMINRLLSFFNSQLAGEVLVLAFRLAQAPLFLVVSIILWRRYRRNSSDLLDSTDQQSRKMLRKVDRRMQRMSFVRQRFETLHQFADRMERSIDSEDANVKSWIAKNAAWYRQFAAARYQGKLPISPA